MDAVAGLLDGPRARGALPAALDARAAVGPADPGRGAADARVRRARRCVGDRPRTARPCSGPATSPSSGARSTTRWPTTRDGAPGRDPPRADLRAAGRRGAQLMDDLGIRSWGNSAEGATMMLTGTYESAGKVSRRLLRRAAAADHCPRRECPWSPSSRRDRQRPARAGGRARPPARPAADRRPARWFARPEAAAPGWYRAAADPSSGPRCSSCTRTRRPVDGGRARPPAGVSRAAFARRFNDLVGEPP